MNRLFLRVAANMLLAVGAAAALAVVAVVPFIEGQLQENIRTTLTPPLLVMAESLAPEVRRPTFLRAFERARERFEVPCEVVPRDEVRIDDAEAALIDSGRVARTGHFLRSVLFVRIPGSDQVIRLGPINPIHPVGQWRGIALVALLLAGLLTGVWLLIRPIQRRLAVLAGRAAEIGRGQLGTRAADRGRDAIGKLAAAFNQMADAIQRHVGARDELLRSVAHELRTPLQRLHFSLERLGMAADEAGRSVAAARMEVDLEELDRLIDELLTYTRLRDYEAVKPAPRPVMHVLRELADAQSAVDERVSVEVTVGDDEAPVAIEERLLRRAVGNLLSNAVRHARSCVRLSVSCQNGLVVVDVDDDGPGVAAADRDRIFEPFQRLAVESARPHRGFGLGLAIVRRIAELHDGQVAVHDSPDGGARFRLTLPRAANNPDL